MSNSAATERILEIVRRVRSEASTAERKFDRASEEIQYKASRSIDIFGGDATSRVADIARDSRRACDDLYTTYQSLVHMLDENCRPLLDQEPSLAAVKEVRDLIVWLNDESEIENNFTASFNSRDLGDVASARYVPSMECKMIQRYWENKYAMWPGRAEEESRQRAAAEERRRAQEEQRRSAMQRQQEEEARQQREYEAEHARWEQEKRRIEELRVTEMAAAVETERKNLTGAVEKAHADAAEKLSEEIRLCEAKKTAAEAKLAAAGFFAFSEKSENKKTIKLMNARIADAQASSIANDQWYRRELGAVDARLAARKKELLRRIEDRYPIPTEPRKPRKSLSAGANPTAVQLANNAVQQAILDWMEPGVLYTITDIVTGCPECADLTNVRVSALVRQLIPTHLERIEDKRKAYFRLV